MHKLQQLNYTLTNCDTVGDQNHAVMAPFHNLPII